MSDIQSQLPTQDLSDGAAGSAAPSEVIQVGGNDGSNLRALSTDTSGRLNLNNIAGTISLPTGAATSALQTTGNTSLATIATNTTGLTVSQGSATSGQSGQLQMGAVSTSAPTYTNATTQPLSLTTSGALRVDSSIADGYLATIATNTGAQAVDFVSSGTITASGTGTGSNVSITGQGVYTVSASITGTFVATLIAEGQLQDTTWVQLPMYVVSTSLPYLPTFTVTTPATVLITGGGYLNVRIRATSYTSGTVNVGLDGSLAQQTIFSAQLGTWAVTASGPVTNGSVASGNPLRNGGVYNSSVQSFASGAIGDMQIDSRGSQIVTLLDGSRATYSAAVTFAAPNASTDVFQITGSATKTVRVLRFWISGTQTTSGVASFSLVTRSVRNTGGTSAAVTLSSYDSNSPASTASVFAYTANATALGTQTGTISVFKKLIPPTTFANSNYDPLVFDFGNRPGQAIVLRGTAQTLSLNLGGATLSGNSLSIVVEWTEE